MFAEERESGSVVANRLIFFMGRFFVLKSVRRCFGGLTAWRCSLGGCKRGNIYIKLSISFPNFSLFPFHHNEKIHLCESSFFFR